MCLADKIARFEANAGRVMCVDVPPGQVGFGLSVLARNNETALPSISVQYRHYSIQGDGETEQEAIDDWNKQLPHGTFELIAWRSRPELVSELDFDTKIRRWRVHSRFSIKELQ